MAQKPKSNALAVWGVVFVAVLAFASTYAIYLYYQPEEPIAPIQDEALPNEAEVNDEESVVEENDTGAVKDWTIYSDEVISFNYPADWYDKKENDFIIFTSWDPQVSPERGEQGMRLVVGHVRTGMSLEQYVGDYLNQNINFDPTFSLLARENTVFGGQPAIMVQSATTLEGGSVIQSMFTLRGDELWSIDLVGKILNQDFQIIFDKITNTFSFK